MVSTLEQMQVPNGTGPGVRRISVLCWLAAPASMCFGNLQNSVIRSKSVLKSSSVISLQIGVMSDQLRVSLYILLYMIRYALNSHSNCGSPSAKTSYANKRTSFKKNSGTQRA